MENTNNTLQQKYRPKNLDDLYGNESVIDMMFSFLDRPIEKMPKVFLFTGKPGTGKTTMAYVLKEELQCSNFFEFNASNERKLEDVRRIIQESKYPALDGGIKIYFFDEVHQLTPAAFEALNKPLEFTEKNTFFILATSEPDKVPAAIKTRATHLHFNSLQPSEILKLLNDVCKKEKIKIDKKHLKTISEKCEGSSRLALKTLDTIMNLEEESSITEILSLISVEDNANIKELCQALLKAQGDSGWNKVKNIVKNLKEEPESVRRAVLGYMNAVLLNNGGARAALIIECFENNYFDSGKAGLSLSCFKACFLD
jgi:DNA polymerase III gamma/tau subunit